MRLTAVARENKELMDVLGLSMSLEREIDGDLIPDTYGIMVGRCYKDTGTWESCFKEDKKSGNMTLLNICRKQATLKGIPRSVYIIGKGLKNVIDYYILYDVQESSKNKETVIEQHIDYGMPLKMHYKAKYELLFTCGEEISVRAVLENESSNVPMYEFMAGLEDELDDALEYFEEHGSNSKLLMPLIGAIKKQDGYYSIKMFNSVGEVGWVDFCNAEELMAMLVSVRQISCEKVHDK